jgi:tRNA A-37 threonylcarbamoyl transferase component Bud32
LTKEGLFKESDEHKPPHINISIITAICKSITITRIGSRLRDAIRTRHMDKTSILAQIKLGIGQLHANGYAHCDISIDNIFVDSLEDGGAVLSTVRRAATC